MITLASPLQPDSIVDGEGIRTVIWTQGCEHHCPGCHNQITWDFNQGQKFKIEEINKQLDKLEGQTGITFSGGDPLYQVKACTQIAKHAKKIGLNVWCYTGFIYENLLKDSKNIEFLKYVDVLVDGPFILKERTLNYDFRGSKNQRIIDVQKSLKQNKTVLVSKYISERKVTNTIEKPKYIYIWGSNWTFFF